MSVAACFKMKGVVQKKPFSLHISVASGDLKECDQSVRVIFSDLIPCCTFIVVFMTTFWQELRMLSHKLIHWTIGNTQLKGTQAWEIVSWCGVTPLKAEVYWTEVVQQTFEVHDMSYSGEGGGWGCHSKGNLHHWNFQISEYLWLDMTGMAHSIMSWLSQWCNTWRFRPKHTFVTYRIHIHWRSERLWLCKARTVLWPSLECCFSLCHTHTHNGSDVAPTWTEVDMLELSFVWTLQEKTLQPWHPPPSMLAKSKWKPCICPVSHHTEQVVSHYNSGNHLQKCYFITVHLHPPHCIFSPGLQAPVLQRYRWWICVIYFVQ